MANTTISQESVSLEDARRVTAAAEECAQEIGQPQNIAVVDAGGNLVSHVRMDGAWIGSVDIAINKAFTARAFDGRARRRFPARRPVLRHPGVQQGPRRDLRRRHPAQA
jgi:uncharacterized protein GlcG (DUF336 family)